MRNLFRVSGIEGMTARPLRIKSLSAWLLLFWLLAGVSFAMRPAVGPGITQRPGIPAGISEEVPALPKLPPGLTGELRGSLERALAQGDLEKAEKLLVEAIEKDAAAPQFEMLQFLGGLFFLDGKHLNAAVAFQKAEALAPLDAASRFTLAMSYVVLGRRDWARPELEKLAETEANPLYLYWLARLDFDSSRYQGAVEKLKTVIRIDPAFVRAYDRLGLCYEALNHTSEAIDAYQDGIAVDRAKTQRNPWPSHNLGSLLIKLNHFAESETHLREALQIAPSFAPGRYQLGISLEKQGKLEEAIGELRKAAELDPELPDPHWALARVLRRTGDAEGARRALERFQALRRHAGDK